MTLRQTLALVLCAWSLMPTLVNAQADAYPTKPVTMVVAFAPGQSGDILARMFAESLGKQWGKSVVIENRPGAGGALGSQTVMRAPADGYTLLMGSSGPMSIVPHLSKVGYDPRKDFTPVMAAAGAPMALVVPVNSRFKTVNDLIEGAKAAPGTLNYGSSGTGSTQHLTMELFKQRAGVNLSHIPYKGGGPAFIDMLGGRLDAMFDTVAAATPFIRNNQVRVLAVATPRRDAALPDVPTIIESGLADFEARGWLGVMAPAGLAPDIRDKINESLRKAMAAEPFASSMAKLGLQPIGGSADDFGKFIASEYDRWGGVIKTGGIKAD